MAAVPAERAGIAGATLNASRTLGLSLGIAVMGAVVAAQWPGDLATTGPNPKVFAAGIASGFIVNAALALVAAVVAATTIRAPITPQRPTPAAPVTSPPAISKLR